MAKNPILALVLSFFIPGLGQVYAGKLMMWIVLIIVSLILSVAIFMVSEFAMIVSILYIIVWLYAMYDAYTTAKAT